MRVAIDFGTTNTVVARQSDGVGGAEVLALPGLSRDPLAGLPPVVPSLLYVKDGQRGEVSAGETVCREGLDRGQDNRLFRNFKAGIGTPGVPPPREIDGVRWDDRDAGRLFLERVLTALPVDPAHIDELVITVPVAAFEGYLEWLERVMASLALERVRVVDEPTAAALGYAVTSPGALVLVVDFGGGTLDLSLVQLPERRDRAGGLLSKLRRYDASAYAARVIAKVGHALGGSDIDRWILDEALDRVGLARADLRDDYDALLTDCEQAKIQLSSAGSATVHFAVNDTEHTLTLTRTELRSLMERHGFFTAFRHAVDKVMHIAHREGVFREDIAYVLTIGGTSLIPSVQRALRQYFRGAILRADKPFTAVAEGALQAAALGLEDYLLNSYGLRHLDPVTGAHRYEEIIPQGCRYPTAAPFNVIMGAAHPNQAAIELVIGMINMKAAAQVEVDFEDGRPVFIARADQHAPQAIALNEFAPPINVPLDPKGQPGQDRIRAAFRVDAARQLRVTVTDLLTRKKLLRDAVVVSLR